MYRVQFTPSAREDLRWFRKFDQQRIISVVEAQLQHEPTVVTQQRKQLRPNQLAEWEVRSGRYRIFYDVVETEVVVNIIAVGYKQGNKLYIRGKEYEL
jgi:mRNA-degrading endonuclease RelE of RelBE toxin-antitoxin system